jgi:uncharacterized integral membrane protein
MFVAWLFILIVAVLLWCFDTDRFNLPDWMYWCQQVGRIVFLALAVAGWLLAMDAHSDPFHGK